MSKNSEVFSLFAKEVGKDIKAIQQRLSEIREAPENVATLETVIQKLNEFETRLKGGEVAQELDTLHEIASKINELVTSNEVARSLTETLQNLTQRITQLETKFTEQENLNLVEVYKQAKTNGV